ncbi:Uncharacterized protein CTRI78_v011526 [Colletotrichum trifolii]|uniref:FAD-binding domain-containing protein n=1 Tax=Colletotrichum trifolii TaxID=5466 RepID=A0A4R8Q9N7_COLTR|nr:Uncharacterized protein CTRI78_v011526 [Colletotrichum trifolii]
MRPHGQNIDVRGAGVTIIRKLGLEKAIRAATTGEEGVQLVDSNNTVWAAIGADKSGRIQTPTSDVEILRGRMAELLYRQSQRISKEVQDEGGAGIEYVFGESLDELDQDGDKVHVRFEKSGERRTFDLVVGADGIQSRTRLLAWGEDEEENRIHRLGLYGGFFSMSRGPTDTQWRRCDQDERLVKAAERRSGSTQAQKLLLKEYFDGCGWETDRIIKGMMATDDFYYDTVSQIKMDKWSKGRVVLLGDAGYGASPLSGMGTTLALNGAYNLAGTILQAPDDLEAAFEAYERSMRPTVNNAQKIAPILPRIMYPETAWGVWLLNALVYVITQFGISNLLARLRGPPANSVPVGDYGFRTLPVLTP